MLSPRRHPALRRVRSRTVFLNDAQSAPYASKKFAQTEKTFNYSTEWSMGNKSERHLKQKLATATEILTWELADIWGHVSAKAPDGKRFFIRHLRPPLQKTSTRSGARIRRTSRPSSVEPSLKSPSALLRAPDQKRTTLESAIVAGLFKEPVGLLRFATVREIRLTECRVPPSVG